MGGSQNIYLLEGAERALLIDTGWGTGNLRPFVERLTRKPVTAALTHGHLDHSGGCGEWESVLMLPGAEIDLDSCRRLPFDISKLPYPGFAHTIVGDGDIIDLGGRRIELLDISAHSNGSLAFLDMDGGLLCVGDELESAQVLMYKVEELPHTGFVLDQRLHAHHANMLRLRERRGGASFFVVKEDLLALYGSNAL